MLIRGHPISVAVHRTGAAMSGAGYGAVREPEERAQGGPPSFTHGNHNGP